MYVSLPTSPYTSSSHFTTTLPPPPSPAIPDHSSQPPLPKPAPLTMTDEAASKTLTPRGCGSLNLFSGGNTLGWSCTVIGKS
ncbi:hypothetical protein Pmani_023704 [Petrolisthes manimaculis]|uniref:Uncharacterized protein n=1 Tax=Petrolisthes manimaculis TaxID=1843537 RepID=A0AAE1TZD4_9EUCA|nr:hypothetical protein Pmani_023704 [Petrolisthes manimaculis]